MREILPLERQYQLFDDTLAQRIKTLLPALMERTGIDMWITICREYNEDPIFGTLVPKLTRTSGRIALLCLVHTGPGKVEALSLGRPNGQIERIYTRCWNHREEEQGVALRRVIKEYHPKNIGVNMSEVSAITDGLTKTLYDQLVEMLGEEYRGLLTSSYPLATAWMETRSEQELARYRGIYAIMMDIVADAYSRKVIVPGQTTTTDLEWYIMEEVSRLGLPCWFTPTVDLQRRGCENPRIENEIILPGDLLHCDVGLTYLGLCTDTQRLAYVPQEGETEVPAGIRKAMEVGNRFQDIVAENFIEGRTGNEIYFAAMEQAKAEGITASLYTHPIGFNGHAAGPTIGLYDQQGKAVPGKGEYPLYKNTCYALELNTCANVPEWDGQRVYTYLEETVAYTVDGALSYLDGKRKEIQLVR